MFYEKSFPTVLFLAKEIAKLERERSVFCPRLFREGGALKAEAVSRVVVVVVLSIGNATARRFMRKIFQQYCFW